MASDLVPLFFSFAPMEDGWAFLFTWHKSSELIYEVFLAL